MKKLTVFILALFVTTITYSQVGYVNGSDFGNYFQVLYKLNQYDKMMELTSKKSLAVHGEDEVLEFYQEMEF